MKILIVGAAGYVGSIIVPALESQHHCRYFDLRPVPGRESKSVVGSVNDDVMVRKAVKGMDAIVYVALGLAKPLARNRALKRVNDIDSSFDVNVRGTYRVLAAGLAAGARTFVYASSMNVLKSYPDIPRISDQTLPAAWDVYGISKRLGENLCAAASQEYPKATIISLRLVLPRTEKDWPGWEYKPKRKYNYCAIGPNDTRRLFLSAVACTKPGAWFLTTTGDLEQRQFDHSGVKKLLGWLPEGR